MKMFRKRVHWAALLMVLFAVGACGKKAPPEAPGQDRLPVAVNLDIELRNNSVVLKWSVPDIRREDKMEPSGFVVYRAKTPVSEHCPDCPLRFERAGWVAYRSGRIAPERWYFEDIAIPGYIYTYKVRSYSDSGRQGEASETVTFEMPEEDDAGGGR